MYDPDGGYDVKDRLARMGILTAQMPHVPKKAISKFLSANFSTLQKDMIFPIMMKSMQDAEANDAKSQFDIDGFSGGPQRAFLQCR